MEALPEDLMELESFYQAESDGLMLRGLDLNPKVVDNDDLSKEYEHLGFTKQKYLFSLKKEHHLKAVFMINISDIGLNLSDLTNCITTLVLDEDHLPVDVLYSTLGQLLDKLEQETIPVLLFPATYADSYRLSYDKLYNFWILNTQYGDDYFNYINRLLRFIQ